jgi:adenylate cyclase
MRADALTRARAAAPRALELDSSNHSAYFAHTVIAYFARDMGAFRAAAERTLALNPLDTFAWSFIGALTTYAGDWEAGLALSDRAMALNPHHPGVYRMSSVIDHYRRGDYEGALRVLDRVNMPSYPYTRMARAAIYGQLGRIEEAREVWNEASALIPEFIANYLTEVCKWFPPDLIAHLEEGLKKVRP